MPDDDVVNSADRDELTAGFQDSKPSFEFFDPTKPECGQFNFDDFKESRCAP
jgi:hypothetical protein